MEKISSMDEPDETSDEVTDDEVTDGENTEDEFTDDEEASDTEDESHGPKRLLDYLPRSWLGLQASFPRPTVSSTRVKIEPISSLIRC